MCQEVTKKIDVTDIKSIDILDKNGNSVRKYHTRHGYLYINERDTGIIWKYIAIFVIIHFIAFFGVIDLYKNKKYYTWIFSYFYGFIGGLGVTAGAHRLWSHRSYKARLPLRILLATFFSIAGQNDLYTWCRDHRGHHKYSETDADPHNSKRGFFFAHMGWLITKKHPEVITKGKGLDLSDLENDPVVMFEKKYYPISYILMSFVVPTLIPVYFWNESALSAFLIAGIWRYVVSLHCTWFVNSAAHMWGDQPYNRYIEARENPYVSFAAFGEGFHNYHHTFPWDYATSELGWKLNATKVFIDLMAFIGLAYDLKSLTKDKVELRKSRNLDY